MGIHRGERTILYIKGLDYLNLKNRERLQQFKQTQRDKPFSVQNRHKSHKAKRGQAAQAGQQQAEGGGNE